LRQAVCLFRSAGDVSGEALGNLKRLCTREGFPEEKCTVKRNISQEVWLEFTTLFSFSMGSFVAKRYFVFQIKITDCCDVLLGFRNICFFNFQDILP
jgi:hypothetical protein